MNDPGPDVGPGPGAQPGWEIVAIGTRLANGRPAPWVPSTAQVRSRYSATCLRIATALLHSLVRNDALVDGNKRLAWSATRIFCLLNGQDLDYAVDEAEDLMLDAASGQLDVPEIAAGWQPAWDPRRDAARTRADH